MKGWWTMPLAMPTFIITVTHEGVSWKGMLWPPSLSVILSYGCWMANSCLTAFLQWISIGLKDIKPQSEASETMNQNQPSNQPTTKNPTPTAFFPQFPLCIPYSDLKQCSLNLQMQAQFLRFCWKIFLGSHFVCFRILIMRNARQSPVPVGFRHLVIHVQHPALLLNDLTSCQVCFPWLLL